MPQSRSTALTRCERKERYGTNKVKNAIRILFQGESSVAVLRLCVCDEMMKCNRETALERSVGKLLGGWVGWGEGGGGGGGG